MNNNGVTMLQIVISVVVMLIILSVSVFYGQNVTKEAKIASIYNEIKEIESIVKEAHLLNDITVKEDSISFYDEIDAPKVDKTVYSKELAGAESGDFYYLDFTKSRKLENVLGIERVKNDYILDLLNLNIYLVGGVSIPESSDGSEVVKYDSDEIVKYYTNTFVK